MPTDGAESHPRCRELKKLFKMVRKLNFSGITRFYEVLGMPALLPTLPGSYKWPPTRRKAPALQGARKTTKKGQKNRNIMGETYFYEVLVCQHVALHSLVRINGPPTRRKAPALQGTRKTTKKGQKFEI
jgi:hypothetical protein